ncbi:MAG: BolA/IbaG family iron-sulfur metabolism protein [Candidatus Schmidhempelia sp.]|nr:BolA/IbaG family iron-sulfur metabolism protein [Candidatus Schmidhempelia sp.]
MMNHDQIIEKLRAALSLDDVRVYSDDGSHFQIIAVSDQFDEMSRVKRQQAVYAPLADDIANNRIHALSIKTYNVAQWQREKKLLGL